MSATSLIIGLTGNIATGKSTVLRYLAGKGAHIIDADKLAHQAMAPGGPAYARIVRDFGTEIIDKNDPNGAIDRSALGRIVFADTAALGRLEQVVHPAVFQLMKEEIASVASSVIVLEAIKLLEAGPMVTLCDEVWVVTASPATQLRRLMQDRGMDETQARQRMQMQGPQAAKINQADRVINNDGTLEELIAQLDAIWEDLKRKYPERLSSPVLSGNG